jgi:hypothetical protein
MITVLIMTGIFWVVNFKTRNYFVIFYYTERLPQVIYRLSQKWRTNGALRCRRNYRKRQKNVKKIPLDLFADLAVFENGT